MASQITSLTIVYSTVYSGRSKKHQSSASLAFVRGIHRWPVNSPHKWPVTRKMFPLDDVIMAKCCAFCLDADVLLVIFVNRIWWLYRSTLVEVIEKISSAYWPLGSGIVGPFKWTGNHTYLGLKNNWGMQSKNGFQNLWGNILFFILC